MDFDHVRGTKEFILGHTGRGGVNHFNAGIKKLKAEIEKCDLVCSNCHRIRTFERAEQKRSESLQIEGACVEHIV